MATPERNTIRKVALITGSGRGIGRAMAEHLAELGYSIAVHGRRENSPAEFQEGISLSETAVEIRERFDVEAKSFCADLTDPAACGDLAERVEETFGAIDVLVHNAGGDVGTGGGKPHPNDCVEIAPEDSRAVIESNLLASIYICQVVAKKMAQRRSGRIITVSSSGAFHGRPTAAVYAAAKAAVVHYTRCLATQMRASNVTVNSIAPGETRTARFLATRPVDAERLVEGGTLDRIAQIDEVSRVVEFFAGPLGDFVSGQVIRVDGGEQCWPA